MFRCVCVFVWVLACACIMTLTHVQVCLAALLRTSSNLLTMLRFLVRIYNTTSMYIQRERKSPRETHAHTHTHTHTHYVVTPNHFNLKKRISIELSCSSLSLHKSPEGSASLQYLTKKQRHVTDQIWRELVSPWKTVRKSTFLFVCLVLITTARPVRLCRYLRGNVHAFVCIHVCVYQVRTPTHT